MIVRPGVLIDAEHCAELAAVLGEHIRPGRGSLIVRRVHAELARVAATVAANAGREVEPVEPVWLTIDQVASDLGRPVRSIRRWAAQGLIKSRKVGRSWQVATEPHGELIWRTGSSARYRPR